MRRGFAILLLYQFAASCSADPVNVSCEYAYLILGSGKQGVDPKIEALIRKEVVAKAEAALGRPLTPSQADAIARSVAYTQDAIKSIFSARLALDGVFTETEQMRLLGQGVIPMRDEEDRSYWKHRTMLHTAPTDPPLNEPTAYKSPLSASERDQIEKSFKEFQTEVLLNAYTSSGFESTPTQASADKVQCDAEKKLANLGAKFSTYVDPASPSFI